MAETKFSQLHTLLVSALRTGSGFTNAINASEYGEAMFYMSATTKEGTDPKLNLTMQVSPDNITWFDTATKFAESSTEAAIIVSSTALGMFVRFSYAITGTNTPKFTFSLKGVFKS